MAKAIIIVHESAKFPVLLSYLSVTWSIIARDLVGDDMHLYRSNMQTQTHITLYRQYLQEKILKETLFIIIIRKRSSNMQLFEIPIKSNYLPPCISGELYLMVIAFQPLFYVIIIMLSKGLIYPVLIPKVIQLVQLHK